jgi:hypothetical protein
MFLKYVFHICGFFTALVVLSACGGSGSGGSVAPSQTAPDLNSALQDCVVPTVAEPPGFRWLAAWGNTREQIDANGGTGPAPVNTTVRNIARVTTGGNAVRLRFFNLDDDRSIEIGEAAIGIRDGVTGAALVSGSNRVVTFCGESSVILPPGTESLYSDPIEIDVTNQDDLAISLHIVGDDNPQEFGTDWDESFKLPNGSGSDVLDESGNNFGLIDDRPSQVAPGTPLVCNGCRPYALRDVEVLTNEAVGVMTFLGSSSFHGFNTSQNQYMRVGDQISVRILNEIAAGRRHTIVNRGIGGDTLEAASRDRIERDIWNTVGVTSVVVWVTNDLSNRNAAEVIVNYQEVIAAAHARGINVFCPTWIPGAQSALANFNGERAALNDWILNSGECDGVADYNAEVEAAGGATFMPQFNSGDNIHSNDAGHTAWSDITPIADWLALPAPPRP